jgi:hypothetical protein
MPNTYPDEPFIKNFYERIVLGRNNFPALKPFWYIEFEVPSLLKANYQNFRAKTANVSDPTMWDINASYQFNVDNISKVRYLIQGVTVPGDGMENDFSSTPTNSSYIKGRIGNGRKNFNEVTISFMENNSSIIDFLIRPWVTIASYMSLKHPGIKTDLHVTQLQKDEDGFKIRKVYNFIKAVPVSVDDEDYDYAVPNSIITRVSKWVYNSYNLEDRKDYQEWNDNNIDLTVKSRVPKPETFVLPEQQLSEPTWNTITANVMTDLKNTAENAAHRAAGELTGTFGGMTGKVVDAVAGGNLVGDLIHGRVGLQNLQIPLMSDTPSPIEVLAKSALTDIASTAFGDLLGNGGPGGPDVPVPITSSDISVEGGSVINSVNAKDINVKTTKVINTVNAYDKKLGGSVPIALRSSDAANPGDDTSKIMAVADIKNPSGDTSTNWDIQGKIINTKDTPSYEAIVDVSPVGNINSDTATHYGSRDDKPSISPYADVPSPNFKVPDIRISRDDVPTNLSKVDNKQINVNQADVVKGNIIRGLIVSNPNDVVIKK